MNMRRRRKIVMSAVAAVVPLAGWFAFVPAASAGAPPYDNSQDTVVCQTVTKGIIKVTPPLITPGTATPTTLTISGTLGGCSSPSNPNLVFPEGKSKFKGTISSTTNDCTSLAGPTSGSGTVTFTWSGSDSVSLGAFGQKTSTLSLPTGAAVGGIFSTTSQPTALYGQFVVGPGNGVAVAPAVTGGFQGGNGGATSNAAIVTVQSVLSLTPLCSGKGIKQLNIATGAIELQ
jgi:hypothetical protein